MIFMPLMTMTASHVHYDLDDLDEPGDGDPGDPDGKGGLSERHPCVRRSPCQRHFVISLNQVSISISNLIHIFSSNV